VATKNRTATPQFRTRWFVELRTIGGRYVLTEHFYRRREAIRFCASRGYGDIARISKCLVIPVSA